VPILCGIDIAVRSGAISDARRLCDLLDEVDCVGDPSVSWFVQADRMRESSTLPNGDVISPSEESRSQARRWMDSSGAAVREVLGAIVA
jgi:hypothetical protein